jgi:hypothetical protein
LVREAGADSAADFDVADPHAMVQLIVERGMLRASRSSTVQAQVWLLGKISVQSNRLPSISWQSGGIGQDRAHENH